MSSSNGVRLSGRKKGWPHWTTPEDVLELVRQVGPIALDPFWNEAATTNPLAHHDLIHNGIEDSWATLHKGLVFVNPPYNLTGKVVAKCITEANLGREIILLVAARTDSKWAHTCFETADAVCLWKGRIKFGNPPPDSLGDAPSIASAFYYWGPSRRLFLQTFGPRGFCLDLAKDRKRGPSFPVQVLP